MPSTWSPRLFARPGAFTGLGFGAMHTLMAYGALLSLAGGDEAFYLPACPQLSAFVSSAVVALLYNILHIALTVLALDALRRALRWWQLVPGAVHLAFSLIVREPVPRSEGVHYPGVLLSPLPPRPPPDTPQRIGCAAGSLRRSPPHPRCPHGGRVRPGGASRRCPGLLGTATDARVGCRQRRSVSGWGCSADSCTGCGGAGRGRGRPQWQQQEEAGSAARVCCWGD